MIIANLTVWLQTVFQSTVITRTWNTYYLSKKTITKFPLIFNLYIKPSCFKSTIVIVATICANGSSLYSVKTQTQLSWSISTWHINKNYVEHDLICKQVSPSVTQVINPMSS